MYLTREETEITKGCHFLGPPCGSMEEERRCLGSIDLSRERHRRVIGRPRPYVDGVAASHDLIYNALASVVATVFLAGSSSLVSIGYGRVTDACLPRSRHRYGLRSGSAAMSSAPDETIITSPENATASLQ